LTRSLQIMAQWNAIQRKLAGLNSERASEHGVWHPNTDVYEGPEGLFVRVELGGVPSEDLRIYLQERALVIEGIRRDPHSAESLAGLRLRQMEIEYGPFQRIIALPHPVDGHRAVARFSGGLLEVRIPRAETMIRKRVVIVLGGS